MKRHLQTFNLILIMALFLLPAVLNFAGVNGFAINVQAAQAVQTAPPLASNSASIPAIKTGKPDSIPEKNAYALTHMEKGGFKYGLFKFFIAMAGVLISCLAIFGGLKLYKKILLKSSAKFDNIDYNKSLESPKDFKEAINLFLDKTDK